MTIWVWNDELGDYEPWTPEELLSVFTDDEEDDEED